MNDNNSPARLLRWQGITLGTLFVGYVGYYICRANLAVATPLILEEFGPKGTNTLDIEDIGWVASIGVLLYALGKITNGISADYLGGRVVFLGGMLASVICTLAFGLGFGLSFFVAVWAANRYFQSAGWVALVKTASRWFPVSLHATVMGTLSMSFLLGDAFAKFYLGICISLGAGWRTVFHVSAASLAAIFFVGVFTLKSSPSDIGLVEPHANPANVYGAEGQSHGRSTFLRLIVPLLGNFSFWLVCIMNFGVTLIRETFNFWTPTYLTQVGELPAGEAAMTSMLFPLVGAGSAMLAGVLSDRSGGRHGRIAVPALVLLIATLVVMGFAPLQGRPILAIIMACAASFFLLAPYSYLSGVIALDLGGKRGASTAAGLIDSAGYLGAFLSGHFVARIVSSYSWSSVFVMLAVAAAFTTVSAVIYWIWQESTHKAKTGATKL